MSNPDGLRISQRDHPELFERVEEALFRGESSVELEHETYEIVSSEIDLEGDTAFLLVKL